VASADILSQDEIDALLGGVEEGEVETESVAPAPADDLPLYDFTSQDRIIRGRMPTLEMVNERFARRFRTSLFNLLRRTPELACSGIRTLKYGDYVDGLLVPTSMNLVKIHPLRGTALFTFEPQLIFAVVDNFFGGGRFHNRVEGRDFTPTELRVIRRLLDDMFRDLAAAWSPVMALEFEYQGSEVNPRHANVVNASEVVVISAFAVELEGGGGELHVALPYSMIEPIRHLLDSAHKSDGDEQDARWASSLRRELEGAEVEVHATLTSTTVTLRELLECRPGSVIPIELPETVIARAEDTPVFRARFGVSKGNLALQVVEMIKHTQQALTVPASEESHE